MTEIIPAIDLMDGRCVRLVEGNYSSRKTYDASALDMAKLYADCGVRRIHVVDLDGARVSRPCNLKTLEALASHSATEIEWGGGICDAGVLGSVFDAGATCAVIGSLAALQPSVFKDFLTAFGGGKIILGADVRDGAVAVKGWQDSSDITLSALISGFLDSGLRQVISTEISRDGRLEGPAFDFYAALMEEFPGIVFTASGGVSRMADIERLNELGVPKAIVGKAIYEGIISIKDIERWQSQSA